MAITISRFRAKIRAHYKKHARAMPWRTTHDPYRILVSEIMLQQTQVSRVAGFYEKFIKQFPDFRALARAKTSDVLRAWQGLGYNRRALALQKLAKEVVQKYGGRLPRDAESLVALPGIGPYTAGAIRAFAFNEPEIFIETNIRRVFIHFFFPDGEKSHKKVTDKELQRYIKSALDKKNPREWYYALMDYGAMLGAEAPSNPNRRSAHYTRQSAFAGSDRELRGKIVRMLLARKKIPSSALVKELTKERGVAKEKISGIVAHLSKEGFITKSRGYIALAN